jgi:Ca2+-binding RTX toxin-like protein
MPARVGLALGATVALLAALSGTASAAISSSFDAGTGALTVSSDAGDSMEFACLSSKVRVNGVAVSGDPNCSAVNSLTVNGGPQGNSIDLQGANSSNYPNATPIVVNGNDGGDFVAGSNQAETIDGGPGGDILDGAGGSDILQTNDEGGPDDLSGGGTGTDTILVYGSAAQTIVAGPSEIGTNGNPITFSGFEQAQFNTPIGEPSIDLTNAPWPSTVNGNTGNETVWTSPFNDVLNLGGQGIADIAGAKVDGPNIFITAGGISGNGVGNDTWNSVERATLLSPSAIGLPGSPAVNSTWDATAANRPVLMQGGSGNDTLLGGSFADTLGMPANPGGPEETGDDIFNGGGGTDTIQPGPGTDTIRKSGVVNATATATSLSADGESDNYSAGGLEAIDLTGTGAANIFNASSFTGRAIFDGGAGADQLTGGTGDDRLTGGGGGDTATGGNGNDTVTAVATLAANLTVTPTQVTDGPNSVAMTSIERVEVTGSSDGDSMDASTFAGTVLFDGAGGNDTLTGGLAADTLLGGAGGDTLNAQGDNSADAMIGCGADIDTANVDTADPTPVDCETVKAPSPGSGEPGGQQPGPGSGNSVPLDVLAPTIGVKAGRVDRRGRFVLRLSCPAAETACTGGFQIFARTAKGKRVRVGRGQFSARGGQVVAAKVRLNAAGRRLFRGKKRLRVTLAMTARDAVGNAAKSSRPLTLKPKPGTRR